MEAGTDRRMPPPSSLSGSLRRWLDTPEEERRPAPAKPSATVMLLREAGEGDEAPAPGGAPGEVEVFILRRAAGMAFAAGMIAFPGGGVDPRDADPALPWAGPSPVEWAEQMGVDEATARELVVAAAREVFEECGVLLAGASSDTVVDDLTDPSWDREREGLLDRSQSFAQMLTRLGLVLRTDLLALRAHWITPVFEPKRYDTRFFAARMPVGQVADDRSSEAEITLWTTPGRLLEALAAGEEIMLPPTRVMLEQLSRVDDLDAWLATPVPVHPVQPFIVDGPDGPVMRVPVDAEVHGVPAAAHKEA